MRTSAFIISVILFVLLWSPFVFITPAQDSLYLISTITGESSENRIDYPMGIGDINGDENDDFMLRMETGIPSHDQTVIKLYFGSADFDLNPDIIFHYPGSDQLNYLACGYGIGDVNNDGYDDFVLSGDFGDFGLPKGKVFLFFGGETIDTIPAAEFIQPNSGFDVFGEPVVGLGDLNNDGYNDFGISSVGIGTIGQGFVFIIWGGKSITWENSLTLSSNEMNDFFGETVTNIGDLNNDGFDDIAVGAPNDIGIVDSAKVYIYYGGEQMDNIPDIILASEYQDDGFGSAIKNAGDLNLDGKMDFCFFQGPYTSINTSGWANPIKMSRGYSLDAGGDVNNDGYSDIIMGQDWKIKVYAGSAQFDTTYDYFIDDADSIGFTLNISFAGDMNNDGYDEIFASSPYFPDPDDPTGKIFIYSLNKPDAINETPFESVHFYLSQNFPNPFNPTTTIGFGIQNKSNVKISVLNVIGEEVAVILNKEKEPGYHQIEFNASNLPSGVYFYQLKAGSFVQTKKMLLLK